MYNNRDVYEGSIKDFERMKTQFIKNVRVQHVQVEILKKLSCYDHSKTST